MIHVHEITPCPPIVLNQQKPMQFGHPFLVGCQRRHRYVADEHNEHGFPQSPSHLETMQDVALSRARVQKRLKKAATKTMVYVYGKYK